MNPAVIRENTDGPERHGEGEPVVAYAGIEYSIRIIWKTRRHAVIVGDPSPIDDIAGPDGDAARVKVGPALPHVHIYRSRGSEDWQQDQKCDSQSEIHLEGAWQSVFAPDAITETRARNRSGMKCPFFGTKGVPHITARGVFAR